MCDLTNTIKPPIQYIWTDYTNRLLGKDSSNFVTAMRKISIFPSTILSKSPDLFLIELIFRYEKITLLRWECCNRFKVTLIFSLYSWLVVDASIRGPIYLLNMLSARSFLFQDLFHTFFFFANILFFATRRQITYFLWSLEENEYAGIKYPINLKYLQKFLLMTILDLTIYLYYNKKVGSSFFITYSFQNQGGFEGGFP